MVLPSHRKVAVFHNAWMGVALSAQSVDRLTRRSPSGTAATTEIPCKSSWGWKDVVDIERESAGLGAEG